MFLILIVIIALIISVYLFYDLNLKKREISSLQHAFRSLSNVQSIILSTLDFEQVVKQITNSILSELNLVEKQYVIIVLALVDEKNQVLRRIGISETEEAKAFLKTYPRPFRTIEVPLSEERNIAIKVLREGKFMATDKVADTLYPAVDKEFVDNLQKLVGLKNSLVFPVISRGKKLGVLIFSMKKFTQDITQTEWMLMNNFVNVVGIAVEDAILFEALKSSNESLKDANIKLNDLDKLKDDFVSVASHELRTPMTAIKSYLYMAINKGDIKLSAKMVRYLTRAYLSTERLINLVNDMLNVSRIEAGRVEIIPKVIDISLLMEDIVSEIMPKADERGVTITTVKSQIPRVFADPDKVYQVVLNLIGNALKFTPPGGTITISFFSDGKTVETSVKDTGVGISQSDISQLFQKFSRLDNSYVAAATSGGTGLGLFISKSLVEMMHGRIGVYSKGVNMGSTFTFSLPVATSGVVKNAADFTVRVEGEVKRLEPIAI